MCDGILWPFAGYHKAATFFFIVSFQLLINHASLYTKAQRDQAKKQAIIVGMQDWQIPCSWLEMQFSLLSVLLVP